MYKYSIKTRKYSWSRKETLVLQTMMTIWFIVRKREKWDVKRNNFNFKTEIIEQRRKCVVDIKALTTEYHILVQ